MLVVNSMAARTAGARRKHRRAAGLPVPAKASPDRIVDPPTPARGSFHGKDGPPGRRKPRSQERMILPPADHPDQGSTSTRPNPSKWRVLRVARVALRALTIPAIWTSRISTVRPARRRSAAMWPEACAAG